MSDAYFQNFPESFITTLLVDGDTIQSIHSKIGWSIDLERLVYILREQYVMPRIVYFMTVDVPITGKIASRHQWLRYRGFELVIRQSTTHGEYPQTSPIPVEIATDAIASAQACDHVILLTRNRDLESVGMALRKLHRSYTLLSDSGCAIELRFSATHFIDLSTLQNEISVPTRPPSSRT